MVRLYWVTFIVLCVAASVAVYSFFFKAPRPPETAASPAGITAPVAIGDKTVDSETTAVHSILERNLFGESRQGKTEPPNLSPTAERRESASDRFRLLGAIAGAGQRSSAVIEDRSTGKQLLAAEGQTIEGLGQVTRIESERVAIASNGKTKWLESREAPLMPVADVKLLEAGPNRWVISRGDLEAAAATADRLMTSIKMTPRFNGSVVAGYEIIEVAAGTLPYRMGLRQGDLLTAINGREVRGFEQLYELYRRLAELQKITIDIIRAGKKITLSYEVH